MQWRDVRLVSIQSKRVRIPQLKTSKLPAAAKAFINPVLSDRYVPTASETHFLVKLLLAAPASFLSFADASHVVSASFSHFLVKLVSAAPASFFSASCALQVAVVWADAADPANAMSTAKTIILIEPSLKAVTGEL
jgi:hypothetical protein